jgi:hypothetical protein
MSQRFSASLRHLRTQVKASFSILALATLLGACGGGSDTEPDESAFASDSDKYDQTLEAVTSSCVDPTPTITSAVSFQSPSVAGVDFSTNRTTACFSGQTAVGASANVNVTQGASNFYYVEMRRNAADGVVFGISGNPAATSEQFQADALLIQGVGALGINAQGQRTWTFVGSGDVFGFAVDYRQATPVVSVIGPASANTDLCAGLNATDPCVLVRQQLNVATGSLAITAYGTGQGFTSRVSINAGRSLAIKPFQFSVAGVKQAMDRAWFQGSRGLMPQWPAATGITAEAALNRTSHALAVARLGDTTMKRKSLAVTSANIGKGVVTWRDESGVQRATGKTLTLSATLLSSLAATQPAAASTRHTLTASVTNPSTGRYARTSYTLVVLKSGVNTDDDGDGLTYDQEKSVGTDPGNPDTDSDGLADGAEAALGTNPAVADSNGDGVIDGRQWAGATTFPLRTTLVVEAGTSGGVVLTDDALSAAFTSDFNPDCFARRGAFADAVYADTELCYKRGVRTNVGVKPGEFRYFETQRIGAAANLGHGLVGRSAQIDPVCCFLNTVWPNAHPLAAPSMAINSIGGGAFLNLSHYGLDWTLAWGDIPSSVTYGFAVDYTGAYPNVYVVLSDGLGGLAVSRPVPVTSLQGLEAVPMLYGHPISDVTERAGVNMGLQKFRHDTTAVKAAIAAQGTDVTKFVPGVGIHRW